MKAARVFVLVLGCLLLLPGMAVLFGGGALGLGYAFARNDDGYFEIGLDRLQTPTPALRSEEIDFLADPGSPDWVVDFIDADIQVTADAVGDAPLFVGIGPRSDVDAYLAGVAYDEVTDIDQDHAPTYRRRGGEMEAAPPVDQDFWAVTAVAERPVLEWEAASGNWVVVLMNADGRAGIAADVDVGARSGLFLPVALFLLGAGIALVGVAVTLIVVGTRRPAELAAGEGVPSTAPSAVAGIGESAATQEHPVALSARLDPGLSRWLWLVKWFLAIPHFVVLLVLWIGFAVMTFAAGVAILFTGRYPQGIYGYNLGVLRWTWRVSYYCSTGGIGTDRYPPFSLGREPDYPAVLDIAYPEQLSRGLVLVKWWLLAIPHYLIVGLLVGGGFAWTVDSGRFSFEPLGAGLLGLLVVITGVILLFTGSYPRSLFDLIVGFNRWIFRVAAYVALMTDRYPPFRLDQGGIEPGAPLPPPLTERDDAADGPGSERIDR